MRKLGEYGKTSKPKGIDETNAKHLIPCKAANEMTFSCFISDCFDAQFYNRYNTTRTSIDSNSQRIRFRFLMNAASVSVMNTLNAGACNNCSFTVVDIVYSVLLAYHIICDNDFGRSCSSPPLSVAHFISVNSRLQTFGANKYI